MTRTLVTLLLAGLLMGLAPAPARACSCMVPEAADLLENSDFAFVGSIIDKQAVGQGQFGGEAVYTFAVTGWAKGNLGETVAVRSADNGAACGYELGPGQEAAIFVSKVGGSLSGGLCSTMDAAALEAVADLVDPIATETPPPPGDTPPLQPDDDAPVGTIVVALAGTAAAAAAGLWVWSRRRRQA